MEPIAVITHAVAVQMLRRQRQIERARQYQKAARLKNDTVRMFRGVQLEEAAEYRFWKD